MVEYVEHFVFMCRRILIWMERVRRNLNEREDDFQILCDKSPMLFTVQLQEGPRKPHVTLIADSTALLPAVRALCSNRSPHMVWVCRWMYVPRFRQ